MDKTYFGLFSPAVLSAELSHSFPGIEFNLVMHDTDGVVDGIIVTYPEGLETSLLDAAIAAHDPEVINRMINAQRQDADTRIAQIKNYLIGITGLRFQDLPIADRWKLLAVILMKFRLLDASGTVQPFENWRFD